MAVLPDADRARVWRGYLRLLTVLGQTVPTNRKADIRAAVDAADVWADANAAAFNSALPVTFRNNATLAQKTLLLCMVIAMRAGLDFLTRFFSEVE